MPDNSYSSYKYKNTFQNTHQTIEKRSLEKAEKLQGILKSCKAGPDIFVVLSGYCIMTKVFLKIPETLLYISASNSAVFLCNHKYGYIVVDTSKQAMDRFFETTKSVSINTKYKVPIYIHIAMDAKIKLCFNRYDAQEVFENCPHYAHRLQRYIYPSTNLASKIRVYWSKNKIDTICSLTNQIPFEKLETRESLDFRHIKKERQVNKASTFTNKILASSFSISLPYRPLYSRKIKKSMSHTPSQTLVAVSVPKEKQLIMNKTNNDILIGKRTQFYPNNSPSSNTSCAIDEENEIEKYVIKYTDLARLKIIITHYPIQELNSIFRNLIEIVNNSALKKSNGLSELFVDFIKDSQDN